MSIRRLIKVGDVYFINIENGDIFSDLYEPAFRRLTKKQLEFILVFYNAGDSVVTKRQIIDAVWGGVTSPESLTQMVNRVRSILDDKDKKLLVNIPGIGYSMVFFDVIEPDSSRVALECGEDPLASVGGAIKASEPLMFRRFGYPQRLEILMVILCLIQFVMLYIFILREID